MNLTAHINLQSKSSRGINKMYSDLFPTLRLISQSHSLSQNGYDVAYLIRMKNEEKTLIDTINSIAYQTTSRRGIIIFLDSGSTDRSLEIAASSPIPHKIYSISPSEFQFGKTCNLVAELANAKYFMFLSGHVILNHKSMIDSSLDYMDENTGVAAMAFRQVPNANTGFNSYENMYLKRTFPITADKIVDLEKAGAFSNAASLIRASVWKDCSFEHVIASEDQIWAAAAALRGHAIVYNSQFDVAHSHDETPAAVFNRVRINKIARFGQRRQPARFLKTFAGIFIAISLTSNGRKMKEALVYAFAHASAYMFEKPMFLRMMTK